MLLAICAVMSKGPCRSVILSKEMVITFKPPLPIWIGVETANSVPTTILVTTYEGSWHKFSLVVWWRVAYINKMLWDVVCIVRVVCNKTYGNTCWSILQQKIYLPLATSWWANRVGLIRLSTQSLPVGCCKQILTQRLKSLNVFGPALNNFLRVEEV